MASSRERFQEMLTFIRRAWTEDRLDFRGRFYEVEGVEVIPKPIQHPHPPFRLAANSPDTFSFAGANAYPIFAGGPVNPINVLPERLAIYRDAMAAAGKQLPEDWLAAMFLTFVGQDQAAVRATIGPSLENYFHTITETIRPESLAQPDDFQRVIERMRSIKYENVDTLMGVFGEPQRCVDRIAALKQEFGFTRMVCWFEIGGLTGHRKLIDAMRLFAERVMPHFN
jgi:alkanesulfonate monooxygenase SsuD/methylene tetrahydromethanopterin reductase-like flavin-dependent oxidoreductase (luciferase family)